MTSVLYTIKPYQMIQITRELLSERPLSFSSLKEFVRSPAHYVRYISQERKQTDAMLLGSVIHCLILTPDEFDKTFIVEPVIDKRTKQGKEDYLKFVESISGTGLTPIGSDIYVRAREIITELLHHQNYKHVKEASKKEFRFLKEHDSGLNVTGFLDAEGDDFVLEVKTVQSCDRDEVIRGFFNLKYHLQAGIYHWATGKKSVYLCIETNPPYLSRIFVASDNYLSEGTRVFHKAMSDFSYCLDMGLFTSGYEFYQSEEIETVDLPRWAQKGGDDD